MVAEKIFHSSISHCLARIFDWFAHSDIGHVFLNLFQKLRIQNEILTPLIGDHTSQFVEIDQAEMGHVGNAVATAGRKKESKGKFHFKDFVLEIARRSFDSQKTNPAFL